MNYIIQIKPVKDYENSKHFEDSLKKFVNTRIGYPNTFEIFNSLESVKNEFHPNDVVRLCTTNPNNCYNGAKFSGNYDFNSDLDTYFIEVSADDKFNPNGEFYPRILAHRNVYSDGQQTNIQETNIQVVGLDYIIKGEMRDENQS